MTLASGRGTRKRVRRGMSLIEVMVAMTMLAMLVMSHTALTMRFAQRQRQVGLGAYRTGVLGGLVNKYMSMPFDTLPNRTGCTTVSATATAPFGYTRCVSVDDASTSHRLVQIVLTPAAPSRADTVVIHRAKNNAIGPFGT